MAMPITFICGHRKSGTSVFHDLFDGHSQLCVYPPDLNLLYGYFPSYNDPAAGRDALLERIGRVAFGDIKDMPQLEGVVDPEALETEFRRRLGAGSPAEMRLVIPALLEAYAALTGSGAARRGYLVKETSIELYAAEIAGWFPDCRFLHLVRDPRDNFAAIRPGLKHRYGTYGDNETSLLFSVLVRNLWGFRMAAVNQRLLGEARYRVVRFEDLASDPAATMRALAAWMGVDYEDSMTRPSVAGKPTAGNNFEQRPFEAVSTANVGRWRERITAEEAAMIEFAFGEDMRRFGYAPQAGDEMLARSVGMHYRRINHKYFYFDRFGG